MARVREVSPNVKFSITIRAESALLRYFRGETVNFCPAGLTGASVESSIDSFFASRILLIMFILSILSFF